MIRCPNCNREQPFSVLTCDCGFDLHTHAQKLQGEQQMRDAAVRPYRFLPTLLIILQVLGVLSLVGGLMYALSLLVQGDATWLTIGLGFLSGILAAIPYFALSMLLTLQLDMNKRQEQIMSTLERIEKRTSESAKI
jgi:hypothetical protein